MQTHGPRANQPQLVRLTCRARHGDGRHDALGFIGVITHEVHRLAHLAHRVAPGFESFLDQQRAEPGQLGFQRVRGATQDGSALGHVRFAPFFIAAHAYIQRAGGQFGIENRHIWHLHRFIGGQQRLAPWIRPSSPAPRCFGVLGQRVPAARAARFPGPDARAKSVSSSMPTDSSAS